MSHRLPAWIRLVCALLFTLAGNVPAFTGITLESGTPQTVDFTCDELNRQTAPATSG